MARRVGPKVVPFPTGASTKPLETQPMTDRERLLWQQFIGPAESAIAAIQQSQRGIVLALMDKSGLDPVQGWVLNKDRLRWERYPVPAE